MRPAAGSAATAATGLRSGPATATASGSGCPRLTGGAVRLKDPVLELSTNDLTAIERGTGGHQRGAYAKNARAISIACAPAAATGRCHVPRMHLPLQPGLEAATGASWLRAGPRFFYVAVAGSRWHGRKRRTADPCAQSGILHRVPGSLLCGAPQ
jgi:hypothetical protein